VLNLACGVKLNDIGVKEQPEAIWINSAVAQEA
jgi:hypothetical protein